MNLDDLLPSIAKRGIISPIIVVREDGLTKLLAGERRLRCARQLALPEVPVRFLEELDLIEQQIIELEENVKRKDLTWQETAQAVAKIHRLYANMTPAWTQEDTVDAIGLSRGWVSLYLRVEAQLADESVRKAGTAREAYNLLTRREERAKANALDQLLGLEDEDEGGGQQILDLSGATPTPLEEHIEQLQPGAAFGTLVEKVLPPNPLRGFAPLKLGGILNKDFREWWPEYKGPKFNLIHCDFPYGVGLFSSNGIRSGEQRSQMGRDSEAGEGYDDSPESYQGLVLELLRAVPSIASQSCHFMFWFSGKWDDELWTRARFAEAFGPNEFRWGRFKLIWHKTDNAGIASAPKYEPRHVYEQALLGIRGNRTVAKLKSDVYGAPTDKSIHVSAKPEPMLRHFFEMLVDEHTVMLDPTCGSGTSVRAAEALGAKLALGLEIDPKMAEMAGRKLEEERRKRGAARALGF